MSMVMKSSPNCCYLIDSVHYQWSVRLLPHRDELLIINLCPKCYLLRYFFSDNSTNKEKLPEINLDFNLFLIIELNQQRDASGNVVDV